MSASPAVSSVLSLPADNTPHPNRSPTDVLAPSSSPIPETAESPNRRQRISMACQYCRHRKIRCCGSAPCRNCARAQRECEYAPVPEETNRATREKKAMAKAARTSHYPTLLQGYSPYFADTPVFDVPYVAGLPMRPTLSSHRRSVSVPNFEATPWSSPSTAVLTMSSPAVFESTQWMYHGWSSGHLAPSASNVQHLSPYPSVLEQIPDHHTYLTHQPATPPESRSSSSEADMPSSWSTPNLHLRVPQANGHVGHAHNMSPQTPISPVYYTSHHTPTLYHQPAPFYSPAPLVHEQFATSPTLAPEMSLPSSKDLVGLGIGMHNGEALSTFPDQYFDSH